MKPTNASLSSLIAASALLACVPQGKYDAALTDAIRARAELQASEKLGTEQRRENRTELAQVQRELAEANVALATAHQEIEFSGGIAIACGEALDESSTMNENLSAELQRLGKDVDQLVATKTELAGSLERARAGVEELRGAQATAESQAAMFREIAQRLARMLDAGELNIVLRSGRMVLVLPADVLFEPGRADVGRKGLRAVGEVGHVLASIPGRRFQVSGHTDADPIRVSGFASNWQLSSARALEVVSSLIQAGMQPASLSAAGYAEFDPVVANDSPTSKARNRRIEIALQPNIEQLVDVSRVAGGTTEAR